MSLENQNAVEGHSLCSHLGQILKSLPLPQ